MYLENWVLQSKSLLSFNLQHSTSFSSSHEHTIPQPGTGTGPGGREEENSNFLNLDQTWQNTGRRKRLNSFLQQACSPTHLWAPSWRRAPRWHRRWPASPWGGWRARARPRASPSGQWLTRRRPRSSAPCWWTPSARWAAAPWLQLWPAENNSV